MPLTDTFVKQTKVMGKHFDGGGMYLHVKEAGRYWRMDYRFNGRAKTLSLGVYPAVSLALARKRRDEARELLAQDHDPSAAKQEAKLTRKADAANTFELVGREWLNKTANNRAAVTQGKVQTWLEKDVFPYIGKSPIKELGPRDVLEKVLRRLEARGAIDTAHRIKQLCGQIFRYAVVTGKAERDVTTDLREALSAKTETNYAAIIEPKKLGELLRSIYDYSGHTACVAALKLSAMLYVRPGELRHAEWSEIDLATAQWDIPAAKMKMGRGHIVPLSTQAVAILADLRALTGHGKYVFPSIRTSERCMSENTVNAALRGMGYAKEVHSAHGFRATARTILDEVLNERVDLIEHQLAHEVKDANGRAYNRTAHLPARRELMQRWSDYLDKLRVGGDVIRLQSAA